MTAPTKNRTRPTAAAIPNAGRPRNPTTSPMAPASFVAASAGIHERGTPTSAAFARTNLAGTRSATAIAAVTTAVVSVITTNAVSICVQSLGRTPRRTIDRVMVLVSFATEFDGCGQLLDDSRAKKVTHG